MILSYSDTDSTALGPKIYINFHMVYVNENMRIRQIKTCGQVSFAVEIKARGHVFFAV